MNEIIFFVKNVIVRWAALSLFVLSVYSCKSGYIVLNKGVAGNNSNDLLVRLDKDVLQEKPDMVILLVGTNDMLNSKKFISMDDYFDNLTKMVTAIRSTNKKTTIVLPSILPVDEDYLFLRHNSSLFPIRPNAKIDALNERLEMFCKDHQLYFIALNSQFRNEGMTFKEENSLLLNDKNSSVKDGVHPTARGYELIGSYLYYSLIKLKILKQNMKIICFGDSITYGAFMKGQGTVLGSTYPSVLFNLINRKLKE